MRRSTQTGPERAEVLQAIADSGRRLSTAMILFHTNLSKRVGLGTTEEKVLELVRRHGHPSVRELAEQTGMAKNSISDVLDRLERKGFVTREPDPADGRRVAIVATEEGAARIGRLFGGMMARLGELNAEYSDAELALIAEYQRRAAEIQADEARALADGSS
ncbi:MarR family winged helix-turn-helix transcriptional regulator [Jiangella gansuensis]|uniref:MarR family winged helix-turn-helix transcriptional regulator n=1 Tax=Jiangella gansuensis TaxID=281473 RepID=UPI0004B2F33B|nr:MarR family transcriptional regulator [Jiangella gansuensis]